MHSLLSLVVVATSYKQAWGAHIRFDLYIDRVGNDTYIFALEL